MTICKYFLYSSESMLSVTYSTLSQAINEMLAIVNTKMDGILDSTNWVKQVTSHVDTNILEISGQVMHIKDGVSQMHNAQTGEHHLFSYTIC